MHVDKHLDCLLYSVPISASASVRLNCIDNDNICHDTNDNGDKHHDYNVNEPGSNHKHKHEDKTEKGKNME